jgi:chromosome partitioning protein
VIAAALKNAAKTSVGKATTATHLAAYLQTLAQTMLVDGDVIRVSTKWSRRGGGRGLPFMVMPVAQMARRVKDYTHIVIDTEANPSEDDFKEAAEGCDLLFIPAEPSTTTKDCLIYTLAKLRGIGRRHHRVLLTKVPPAPQTEGQQLRAALIADKVPFFKAEVPMLVAFKKASAEGKTVADIRNRNVARVEGLPLRGEGDRRWLRERENTVACCRKSAANRCSYSPRLCFRYCFPRSVRFMSVSSDPAYIQKGFFLKKESVAVANGNCSGTRSESE